MAVEADDLEPRKGLHERVRRPLESEGDDIPYRLVSAFATIASIA